MRILLIRLLSLAALLGALYLTYQRATGDISAIAGCGGSDSSCANVLGGRWSVWLGLSVTVLAAGTYLAVLISTFIRRPDLEQTVQLFQSILGALIILAALWFMSVMTVVLKSFCAWCFALHVIGLILGVLLLKSPATIRHPLLVLPVSFVLFLGLPLGQLLAKPPQTHAVETVGESTDIVTPGVGRQLTYLNGALSYTLGEAPFIGSPEAKHVFVEFFDYTCRSCRDLYQDLGALSQEYPDGYALILLPAPLERSCNPLMTNVMRDHPGACDKARIALAAWKVAPEKFYEVHSALMTMPIETSVIDAAEAVGAIVGKEALRDALSLPWVNEQIAENVKGFGLLVLENNKMPKLLIGDQAVHGLMRSTEEFVATMGQKITGED